MEEIHLNVTHY